MLLIMRCRLLSLLLLSLLSMNLWAGQKTLMVFGDSLSAAYGLDVREGWVSLLEQKMLKSHPHWQIVNLSISGETTSGGLSRLPAAIKKYQPDLILLELGANDGLRGTPLKAIKSNFERMLTLARKKDIDIIMFENASSSQLRGSVYPTVLHKLFMSWVSNLMLWYCLFFSRESPVTVN